MYCAVLESGAGVEAADGETVGDGSTICLKYGSNLIEFPKAQVVFPVFIQLASFESTVSC
jgi:hypothetical protein